MSLLLPNNSYKSITNTAWVRARLCKLQKGCTRLAAASDKVYQLLVHGRWLSPGTPASSTTKTGRHDINEILLKVGLKHKKSKSNLIWVHPVLSGIFVARSIVFCVLFFLSLYVLERFEDTKGEIRRRKLKKDIHHNRQKKKEQKDKQWLKEQCTENYRSSNTNPT
jgi:hypothetical protein